MSLARIQAPLLAPAIRAQCYTLVLPDTLRRVRERTPAIDARPAMQRIPIAQMPAAMYFDLLRTLALTACMYANGYH
jgi:hypothetical protein